MKIESFLGGSKEVKEGTKVLDDYLDQKDDSEKIEVQSVKLVVLARKPIKYSVYSLKLLPEIYKDLKTLKKIPDENSLRREITKKWELVEKKNKFKIDSEARKIIIDSAVKTVGGKKW